MSSTFDIAVIGGGAAGCAAAREASRLGARVVLIERKRLLGGAAWLRGRMPARMLQQIAAQVDRGGPVVRSTDQASLELAKLLPDLDARRLVHSQQLTQELTDHRVLRLHARAKLAGDGFVDLTSVRGEQHRIQANHIILATGDRTVSIPGARIDHELVLDPGSALSAVYLPRTLVVIGSSPAAIEMAGLFSALGTHTRLIVAGSTVLPRADQCLQESFLTAFRAAGGEVLWQHKVVQTGKDGQGGARCTVQALQSGEQQTFDVDRIIVAARREATGRSLCLDAVGLYPNKAGLIDVDSSFRTVNAGISAVGSAIGAGTSPTRVVDQARRAVHAALGSTDRRTDGQPHDPRFVDAILSVPELAHVGVPETAVDCALVATVFESGCGLKMVADASQRVVGLHAWGSKAESRVLALNDLVRNRWSLDRVANHRGPVFERARQAAMILLGRHRDLQDIVIDPDDLLAGIVPIPTGSSAA